MYTYLKKKKRGDGNCEMDDGKNKKVAAIKVSSDWLDEPKKHWTNKPLWEKVSNFVSSFKDEITDDNYNQLLVDVTWWEWKIASVVSKATRRHARMTKPNSSKTVANSSEKKPYVQKLVIKPQNPFVPQLVKTQIVHVESMLNLMEHCNDLSVIVSELIHFDGNFGAFAEILHQSNPTLIPMVSFDSKKYWVKCVLLNACFHNLYFDRIDYKTQIIDSMYSLYELPISVSCDKSSSFVSGDEFDKDCQGFSFVHY
ncbi:hypothetical protein RFI_34161 [Reticulomyxa filosa]|uniref:Uncharacterized protein n=1 Tax=Reticulomyxa filosa TaxID=46433 RepID=X6LNQ2_RETFI|nr:hypothetical protein RFI_34161 [Reticulomyxa filosa]|eukprot:ETO03249.1 hypothetical protein RFI_34161 [Reticulomyxa filosa]